MGGPSILVKVSDFLQIDSYIQHVLPQRVLTDTIILFKTAKPSTINDTNNTI
jgi:hypothetical protein